MKTLTKILFTCCLSVACTATPLPEDQRYDGWAQPLDRPGLNNLYQVTPTLLRGAQPDAKGFAQLAEMGVRTVVNLRQFGSDQDEIQEAGPKAGSLHYVEIPMQAWNVEPHHAVQFLKVATDPASQPRYMALKASSIDPSTSSRSGAWKNVPPVDSAMSLSRLKLTWVPQPTVWMTMELSAARPASTIDAV